jgi:ATP-binding cassette, subfamily B, bacterial
VSGPGGARPTTNRDARLVSWTLSYLGPYRWRVAALGGLGLLEILLGVLQPWPLKAVVDSVLGNQPLHPWIAAALGPFAGYAGVRLLIVIVIGGLLIQVGNQLVSMLHTQVQVDTGQRMLLDLRRRLFERLQGLPLRHHVSHNTGDAVFRIEVDAYCIDSLVMKGILPLASAVLTLAVMFTILLRLDWVVALLSLAVVPFLYGSLRFYMAHMVDRAERVQELESNVMQGLYESFSAIKLVKSFARETFELGRFLTGSRSAIGARIRLTWQESLFSVVVSSITLCGTAVVVGVGAVRVMDGHMTVGSLLVVLAYLNAVYGPLSAIAHTTGSLQQAIASARRVRAVLAMTPEEADDAPGRSAAAVAGHIRFEHVSFAYAPEHPVLDGVSFDARPGEMVALVGLTGAGKTSLVSLIPRLYDPTGGRVSIDGVDAREYQLRSLRDRIALVTQDAVLFSGTIADNIRYGRLDATDDEIERAARAAHAHEFIARMAHGYATDVAEAGATLSGGERQRVAIARAVLKNAPILILDEPTSALDAISEARVFAALRELRQGRTTIVIAHRLSTVRDADRILVLDGGRVVAEGTHEALLRRSDLYRRMCARLSVGRSLDEPETVDELIEAVR